MISDEERREVARKLRSLDEHIDGMPLMCTKQEHDALALRAIRAVIGKGDIFHLLADLIEPQHIDGNTSDGYHTFNELYHHRAVLFSVIVGNFATRAWKSKLHADGTMYEGMFIVGIETPDGQATYHYDVEPYWHLFRCKEVDRAPEWDGHTPGQAIDNAKAAIDEGMCGSLKAGGSAPLIAQGRMVVRRLTPMECERLQGFPDDWTKVPYRGKPAEECPDGPRYKAIGNSFAVPVVRWIGERIAAAEGEV